MKLFRQYMLKHSFYLVKICRVIHFMASLIQVTSLAFKGRTLRTAPWGDYEPSLMMECAWEHGDVLSYSLDINGKQKLFALLLPSVVPRADIQLPSLPHSNGFFFTYQPADSCKIRADARGQEQQSTELTI